MVAETMSGSDRDGRDSSREVEQKWTALGGAIGSRNGIKNKDSRTCK